MGFWTSRRAGCAGHFSATKCDRPAQPALHLYDVPVCQSIGIIEAIRSANTFLLRETGVEGEPEFVRLVDRAGGSRAWLVVYPARLFFVRESEEGAVIDGGEYIVYVDESTGHVMPNEYR